MLKNQVIFSQKLIFVCFWQFQFLVKTPIFRRAYNFTTRTLYSEGWSLVKKKQFLLVFTRYSIFDDYFLFVNLIIRIYTKGDSFHKLHFNWNRHRSKRLFSYTFLYRFQVHKFWLIWLLQFILSYLSTYTFFGNPHFSVVFCKA